MDATESAAIAASLPENVLLQRVYDVCGGTIGNPLHDMAAATRLREEFDLEIEWTGDNPRWRPTVFAFNDDGVCAAVKGNESFTLPHWERRAICIAVASMWTPGMARHPELSKAPAGRLGLTRRSFGY